MTPLAASAETEPLVLEVTLTGPARYGAVVGAGCEADGAVARCGFEQPAQGQSVPAIELAVEGVGPGAEATARILRGETEEAVLAGPVPLTPFEDGLALTEPTWTAGSIAGYPLPVGLLAVGARQDGASTITGASIDVTLSGDGGLLTRLPVVGGLLPPGCQAPESPAIETTGVVTGLPTTVTCALGDLPTGSAQTFDRIIALVRPLYDDGDGRAEDASATVTLRLGDVVVDERVLPLTPTTSAPPG